jgi:Gpi18-like mannosyltransferase
VLIWVYKTWKMREEAGYNPFILAALVSVALVPFILPRMHERYFYLQDLTTLIAAFFMPELWFLPILSQVISVIAYGPFLFNYGFSLYLFGQSVDTLLYLALPFEVIVLAVILRKQFHASQRVEPAKGRSNQNAHSGPTPKFLEEPGKLLRK